MADALKAVVLRNIAKAHRCDAENLLFLVDEENIRICWVLVVGLGHPLRGGEYFLKLTVPPEFPAKPPELRACTKNGVYTVGPRVCISIGEFHAGDRGERADGGAAGWKPVTGLWGFAREALNGMIVPESLNLSKHPDSGKGGIGIEDTPPAKRARLAAASRDYNRKHNAALRARFESTYLTPGTENSKLKAAQAWRRQNAQLDLAQAAKDGAAITRAQSAAAYGEEFCAWCEGFAPALSEWALRTAEGAKALLQWDDDTARRCSIAAKLICEGGAGADAAWAEVQRCYAPLAALRPRLEKAFPLGAAPAAKADLSAFLQKYLELIARCEFEARDAHVSKLPG